MNRTLEQRTMAKISWRLLPLIRPVDLLICPLAALG